MVCAAKNRMIVPDLPQVPEPPRRPSGWEFSGFLVWGLTIVWCGVCMGFGLRAGWAALGWLIGW